MSGTSMASPHIAGAAALLWAGPAIMLVLIVIAANQPAVLLHKLRLTCVVLLKCLFGL